MRLSRLIPGSLLLLALAGSLPARAWDPETHEAIVKSALVLSPEAELRLPAEFRDALYEELRAADMMDRICRFHRGPGASKDPAAEAAKVAVELRGASTQRPYARARALGRYLHYVADCAVPTPIAEGRVFQIPDYWSNIDFVLYRQRVSLDPASLAGSLRAAGAEAQWGDDAPNAWPASFRLAVNMTVDALLLLPARPKAAPIPVAGDPPVVFVVNRQDTGRAGSKDQVWAFGDSELLFIAVVRTGDAGPIKRDMMKRQGVQVAEAVTHAQPTGTAVRAVLFNNGAPAACGIVLKAGKWSLAAGDLSGGNLLPLAFELPKGTDLAKVKVTWTTSTCASAPGSGAISTASRIVLGATGSPPRFDRGAEVVDMHEASNPGAKAPLGEVVQASVPPSKVFAEAPAVYDVALDPNVQWDLKQYLDLKSFRMRPQGKEWKFQLSGTNLGSRPLGYLEMTVALEMGAKEPATAPLSLVFDGNAIAGGRVAELNVTVDAFGKLPVAFRVTRLRRIEPTPTSRAPAVTNRLPK